jgi:hypothetical protein
MGEKSKKLNADPQTSVTIRSNNGFRKSPVWVERNNFYGDDHKVEDEPYLIIGFDTEYKSPSNPVTRDQLKAGEAKFTVLSYQFHCSLYDPAQPNAIEWSGICFPDADGSRLKLADFLTFAFFEGIRTQSIQLIPSRIYLVGHFTRADVPAFADFQTLRELISSVRSTFLSIRYYLPLIYFFPEGGTVELKVTLRDTWLLTPAASKSLRALGELVGVEKIVLHPEPDIEQRLKDNMDQLLRDDPDLFVRYAINDAVICTRYLEQVISQYHDLLGQRRAPATLSSIGVKLLLQFWNKSEFDALNLLGKERTKQKVYSKRLGHFVTKAVEVDLEQVHLFKALAVESYHGGRNEQFWFGPAFEDDWTDYDLAGAYPTAMALIGKPDWRAAYVSTRIADYTPTTLGVASVEFEFPKDTRFPTLPVRTDNGLVFPLKGTSYCAAPEIALAKSLNAKIAGRRRRRQ